jgi:hypothetical protein
MLARRLLIALALLMAITALAAGLAPRKSPLSDTPAPASPARSQAAAEPVEKTLDAQADGQRVEARVGQIVRITVNTDELDSVSIDDLGTETADPDSPAHFEVLADAPGTYPIELLDADRQIGELVVNP